MKNLLFLLLLITTLTTTLAAQRRADISSAFTSFDKTSMEAMQMTLDAEPDRVMDLWDEFWDDRYDVDVDKIDRDKTSTAYKAEQVNLPLISSKAFDLYSKIGGSAERSTVSMAIAFTANDVATRDKHRDSYEAGEAIMNEFYTYFYSKYFDEKLEEARDDLDDIRDDSQDASKDAEKARKKIAKMERKIEKLREDIEETRAEVGDELQTAEDKAARARELEERVRELERQRARYL